VPKIFAYIDPPYFEQGISLYGKEYGAFDHVGLSDFLKDKYFVLSYDDNETILNLYKGWTEINWYLNYSGRKHRYEKELIIKRY